MKNKIIKINTSIKKTSILEFGREDLFKVKDEIITLAQSEELTAHANSIQVRFEEEKKVLEESIKEIEHDDE